MRLPRHILRSLAVFAAALLGPAALAAQAPAAPSCDTAAIHARWAAEPGRVTTTDGLASLVVPAEMRAIPERDRRRLARERKVPVLAVEAGKASMTITFSEGDSARLHSRWRALGREYTQSVLPGMVSLGDSVVEIGGRRWRRSGFTLTYGEGSHHLEYETWFRGGILEISMSASRAEGPRWAGELDKAMETIELVDCHLSGDHAASRADPGAPPTR